MVRPFAVLFGVALAGCGSRGPLDIEIIEATSRDGGVDVAVAPVDAGSDDAAQDAEVDAGREASVLNCGQCLMQQCGPDIFDCLQSPPCQATFQCVVQKCLVGGGGTPNPSCISDCGEGSKGIGGVLAILTCVTGKCGPDCTSLLGGLVGGGGGGGGRRDGG
jgi:hypothetical protein